MSDSLTTFERAVLDAFLAGEDPRLQLLQAQARVCTVAGRRHTGAGSFIELSVPGSVPRVSPPAITMGDVDVLVEGLPRGATAMLLVRHGALVLLEFVTNEGDWPLDPVATGIRYIRYEPASTGGYVLVPASARDPATLALQLAGHKSSAIRPGIEASVHCPLCLPRPDESDQWIKVCKLTASTLYLNRNQTYRGHCQLIHDEGHVVGLENLAPGSFERLMGDLHRAASAISRACRPDLMNYASFGNVVPHLHWHLVPRYKNDPRWGMPIYTTDPADMPVTLLEDPHYRELVRELSRQLRVA